MKNYRLGNIELRKTVSLKNVSYWKIVCYYPNYLYNKESDFEWDEYKQMYRNKETPNYYANKECFKNPESCYTIAIFKRKKDDDGEPNLESVCSRPFQLTDEDYDNYRKVAKYAYDNWEAMYDIETYNEED